MFTLGDDSPVNAILVGAILDGQFTGGPGDMTIRMALVPGAPPITLNLIGARIVADVSSNGCMNGKIGGAIVKDTFDDYVFPAIAGLLIWTVENDAGCQAEPAMCGSAARLVLELFDIGIRCTEATAGDVCPSEAPTCGPDPAGGGCWWCGCEMSTCMGSLPGDGGVSWPS